MCSRPAKLASGPPMPKAKADDSHVLDRGIGEHALDVATAVEHESRENNRDETHVTIRGPGVRLAGFAASSILNRNTA